MAKKTLFEALAPIRGYAEMLRPFFRQDGWYNTVTGLGTLERDKTQSAVVKPVEPLQPEDLENLYDGDDLARRIVSALPYMALRQGFGLIHPMQGEDGTEPADLADDTKTLKEEVRNLKVLSKLLSAKEWGRLYGRGALLLIIEGAGNADTPYDPTKGRGVLKDIVVLDRRDFSPSRFDPLTMEPELWRLNASGQETVDIHPSRLIMFGGAKTSRRKRANNDWSDYSVLQVCYDVLRDTNTVWQSTVHLMSDASQAVYKLKGLFDQITTGDTEALETRMALVDMSRSVARAIMVDSEDEDFTRNTTSFAGVPETLDRSFQRLAATARMPVTVLMGMSPAGLNATGEADIRSWYSEVESCQTLELQEPLETLIDIIALSLGLPTGWQISWPSLWTMSPPEEAAYRKTVAETDKIEIDGQVLMPEEVAAHRHSGEPDAWTTPVPIDVELRTVILENEKKKMEEAAKRPDPVPPVPPQGMQPAPNPDQQATEEDAQATDTEDAAPGDVQKPEEA